MTPHDRKVTSLCSFSSNWKRKIKYSPPSSAAKQASTSYASALKQGIAKNIYQKDLVKNLNYSNKTIIENLKALTTLGVLNESMEKNDKEGRIIWIKAYQLTNLGKWFALLLAEETELSETEKAEILQSLFRTYVKQVKRLAEQVGINKKMLEETFREEMKNTP